VKILVSINSLSAGGAEVFATSLAIALKRAGHDVRLFTYCGAIDDRGIGLEHKLAANGIRHASPKIRRNLLKPMAPMHMVGEIAQFKPDVIHSNLEQSDFFSLLAARLSRHPARLIRTIHNVYASATLPRPAHRFLADNYHTGVACSEAVLAEYPYLGTDGCVIDNGIDLDSLIPTRPKQAVRERLGLSDPAPLLVNVGALAIRNGVLQKGQDIIINALARQRDQPWWMLFLGDGEQRNRLVALADSLGIGHRCRFPGRVDDPASYIHASDLVLMPSRFEGLSIGCIEAACAGKPLIVTDIAAFNPFRGPATRYVPKENVEALAEALRAALASLPALASLAHGERTRYRSAFGIDNVASRYLQLYRADHRQPLAPANPI
jgi:glycosyltransferase involved in cell wall biosynthesis